MNDSFYHQSFRYEVIKSKKFRKDYKRIMRSRYDHQKLDAAVALLAQGKILPAQYKNHRLKGNKVHLEECHIEPDWLLVYERSEEKLILILTRTGTHTQLFDE